MTHFELLARPEKARSLAAAFHVGGISSADVLSIQPDQWRTLTNDLKRAGVLKRYATVPSRKTIAETVHELVRMERETRRAA